MAKEFPITGVIDNLPTFAVTIDKIWELCQCKKGGVFKYLSPLEAITDRQRRWYKGVCLPWLVKNDENKETIEWWDMNVKRECSGLAYLKKKPYRMNDGTYAGRLTTKGVGKKKMTLFIEEILAQSVARGWGVAAPDAELRTI